MLSPKRQHFETFMLNAVKKMNKLRILVFCLISCFLILVHSKETTDYKKGGRLLNTSAGNLLSLVAYREDLSDDETITLVVDQIDEARIYIY